MFDWIIILEEHSLLSSLELVHVHAYNIACTAFENKECSLCGSSVPKEILTQVFLLGEEKFPKYTESFFLIDLLRDKHRYPTILSLSSHCQTNHKSLLEEGITLMLTEPYTKRFQEINN